MTKPGAAKQKWLYGPRQFEGVLSRNQDKLTVKVKVSINRNGELVVGFAKILCTNKSRFLFQQDLKTIPYFKLTGNCGADDSRIEARDVHVSQWRKKVFADRPAEMRPLASSLHTVIRLPGTYDRPPQMRFRLKGFECIPRLQTLCPLGSVIIAGERGAPKIAEISGSLAIRAGDENADPTAWRKQARGLFEHVLRILDFAAGLHLKAPIEEFNAHGCNEVVVIAQTDLARDALPVFHFMDRQNIFDIAVSSYFMNEHPSKKLDLAMAWMAASAPHDEIRFTNVLTALENIVDVALDTEEQMFISKSKFDKLAKAVRRTIREKVKEPTASRMFCKISELNRVALIEKLALVVKKWDVPVSDFDWVHIEEAIGVRNKIVHTGRHTNADKRAKSDLWDHIQIVRELAVRMLPTALGYEGQYISHIGGYHLAKFPP